MDFIKSEIKNIIVFVVILGGLYFAYVFFFKDSAPPTSTISPSGSGGEVSGDILPLLLQLQTIKLDQSIFSDPVFKSLENFSVELPHEESGRPNPFAPVESSPPPGSINLSTTPGV